MRLQRIVLLGIVSGCGLSLVLPSATADTQPPNPPTGVIVYSYSPTTLQARWTSESLATSYYVEVATDRAFTALVPDYSNRNVGNVDVFKITGLEPETTYYVR